MRTLGLVVFVFFFSLSTVNAADFDPVLGTSPKNVVPIKELNPLSLFSLGVLDRAHSDLSTLIARQTPVKNQGRRGTCAIFSSAGALESILKIQKETEFDLSENYLEYAVMTWIKPRAEEGSEVYYNVPALQRHGIVNESDWPYEDQDWTGSLSGSEAERAEKMCGNLSGNTRKACLLSHLTPSQDTYSDKARELHRELNLGRLGYQRLYNQTDIRRILDSNYPVLLGVEFFYGAWNHRLMTDYGIGERDMNAWNEGVVGIPSSRDISISRRHGAGHSIILVGYDDAKRVYFFKNSWGTSSFGTKSDLLGSGTTVGYGTIPYEYAHQFGEFYFMNFGH